MAPRKIPTKYSCEEIYDRMSNGLCIFCEDLDVPGHHDSKHKGVKILVTESEEEDKPMVTKNNDELILEESLVESDEYVTKTTMKSDAFSEPLEAFTSDLQIIGVADQKEDQNKSDAEEIMSFSLGRKIEHLVGNQSQKDNRVWEPGGLPTKTDYWPEKRNNKDDMFQPIRKLHMIEFETFGRSKNEDLCEPKEVIRLVSLWNKRVWEPGGVLTENDKWKGVEKGYNHGRLMWLMQWLSSANWFCCKVAELPQVFHQPNTYEHVMKLGELYRLHVGLETWQERCFFEYKFLALLSSFHRLELLVISDTMKLWEKKSRRVWERGGLTATCALAIVTPMFYISFDDVGIQEMRKSCVLVFVGSVTLIILRWPHMIKFVCSIMIKLDEKFKSLEKATSDVYSLLNILEPIMPSSRRQLAVGLRQSTFAGMKFHLKPKWGSRLYSCEKKSEDGFKKAVDVIRRNMETFSLQGKEAHLYIDNQMPLDGIAENDKVILVKFRSTYSYNMSSLKLELICVELDGGKDVHLADNVKELAATDHVRMRLSLWDVAVELFAGCDIKGEYTEYISWFRHGMQDNAYFNHFLFGAEMFQVKHKWRYKPFPIVSGLELKDEIALGTRNENVLSCYITSQAREKRVSLHVDVKRTTDISQVLLLVMDCYGDLTSYGEAVYINFQCYKPVRVMVQEDRNLLKVVQAHKEAVIRCLVQWKEHPPDQVLKLSSLRTRMFSTREYCYMIITLVLSLSVW